jgi:HEAT repeat protein
MHLRSACKAALLASILILPATVFAAVPDLSADIKALSSTDETLREQAVEKIAKLAGGPDAKEVVATLVKALDKADSQTQYEIVSLLADFGKDAQSAALPLTALLKSDKDELVRAAAARSLGHIAGPESPALAPLADAIVDPDVRVRRAAVRALVRIHPDPKVSLPIYLKVLEDADPRLAAEAITTAAEMGEKIVPRATAALAVPKIRYWALLLLEDIGPAAKSAAPDVAKLLSDEQPEVRMHAALTLGQIGPGASAAVPQLMAALNDKETAVKIGAAYALGKIGAKDATAVLSRLMASQGHPLLSAVCAWALVQINPDDQQLVNGAVNLFTSLLTGDKVTLRRQASKSLAELKVAPVKAIPSLIAAMSDSDPQVLENVSEALVKWGRGSVVEIAAALRDPKRRECAVRTLARMGKDAKAAVPQLAAALRDANPMFRREALFALAHMGSDAASAVPQIEAELADQTPEVRYAAIYALGKVGPAAKAAAADLRRNLNSEDEFLKIASMWALLQIQGKDEQLINVAVPAFTKMLKDDQELRRLEATNALGELGPAAAKALPTLKELAESDTPAVRKAAKDAIAKIGGGSN